jgi:glycosyltransferase involved in cell wall biosynthesis
VLLYTRYFEFAQERLYRAFAGICRRVPGVRFLVVGKGRRGEEELLLAAARESGFTEALIMAGWVEPHEIPDYLAAADVAIYPLDDTLVNRAKCPAKLTEIILAGIPVVADGVGQAREYITDNDLLCNPADESGMVGKVVTVINNRKNASLSGEQGRRHIVEHFTWKKIADGLEGFYRR